MGRIEGVITKTKEMTGRINPRYDLKSKDIEEIHSTYGGNFDSICCAFKFGYLQGMKAVKAEMRQ